MNIVKLTLSVFVLCLSLLTGNSHGQTTLTVNSTSDVDDQNNNNSQITLREAIRRANQISGQNTINFNSSLGANPVIRVTGGEYRITDRVIIDARSLQNNLVLDAQSDSRIFHVNDNSNGQILVRIYGIDVTGGNADGPGEAGFGGAIINEENLRMMDCSVLSSFASSLGGGVHNFGTFNANRVAFQFNQAQNGGGICNAPGARCILTRSNFRNNEADFGGDGGGLFNQGNATLSRNQFIRNQAGGGGAFSNRANGVLQSTRDVFRFNTSRFGGAIDNAADLTISQAVIRSNSSTELGGGVSNFGGGVCRISRSTLDDNSCDLYGGALANDSGSSLVVTDCTITNNVSETGAGLDNLGTAMIDDCQILRNEAQNGGGIYNLDNGFVSVTRTRLMLNSANQGGAIHNFAEIEIATSLFDRNSAADYGGGISVEDSGTLDIQNSTLSSNTAANYGGGIDNVGEVNIRSCTLTGNAASEGSSFFAFQGLFTANNNIVNNSDVAGSFNGSFNLFSASSANVNVSGSNNLFSTNPRLGNLTNNGGPTPTHALNSGSPAINRGGNFGGAATDQRGRNRVVGGRVDIGAFEAQ